MTKKFNIKEWQDKALKERTVLGLEGLEDVKDAYYGISDELADMSAHIESVRNTPAGMKWEEQKLGKGGFQKEIKLFQKIERLFHSSKLGKAL